MTNRISRTLGTFLLLANIAYFIPLTSQIVAVRGADCNIGMALLPMTLGTHLLLIPATWTWIDKDKKQVGLLVTNSLGTIWTIFWMGLLL